MSKKIWRNPGPDEGWSWIILIAAIVVSMLTHGFWGGSGLIFSEMIRVFGVTREQAMWPFSILSIAQSFGGLSCGVLNNLCGARGALAVSAFMCSLSLILCYWATNVLYISYIFGTLFGFGIGLGHSLAAGMICKYFIKYRSTATGLFSAGIPLGGFLYPILTNYLLTEYELRGTMLLLGGITLHLLVVSVLMRSRTEDNFPVMKTTESKDYLIKNTSDKQGQQKNSTLRSSLKEYVDMFKDPAFYVVSLQAVMCTHTLIGISLTLNDHLSDSGIPRTTIVTLLSVLAFSDLVGRCFSGFIVDRYKMDPRRLSIVALLFQGLCTYLLCMTSNIVLLFFVVPVLTFMQGGANPIANILYCKYIGTKNIFAALSLKTFFVGMCGLLRPFLIGISRDYLGTYIYYYLVVGSGSILSFGLWIAYPWIKCKRFLTENLPNETKV